jgi:hypothetical protein
MFLERTAAERILTFGPGLTETPEVLNTISVGNSLRFLMVHNAAPTVSNSRVTVVRNSTGLLNRKFWADYTFRHMSGFSKKFQ